MRMSNIMAVLLNGIAQFEFDRERVMPKDQAQYLDNMDAKMATGIVLEGKTTANPDINQRAQFVARNLAQAIKADNEPMAGAMTSWLATRLPELKQVKIDDADAGVAIELVFDEEYRSQVAVQFDSLH